MKKPDRTQVAGCALMLVVLAIGIGAGVAVARFPADEGDLLSFAGALLGAGLTVFGAIYLFEHQRHQAGQSARKVMKELLQEVLDTLAQVRAPEKIGDVEDYVPAVMVLTNVDRLKELIAGVQDARQWFTPESSGMIRAYAQIGLFTVDKDAIADTVKPAMFYSTVPNVEKHIKTLEHRVKLALAQMDL